MTTRLLRREPSFVAETLARPSARETAETIRRALVGASEWTRAAADTVAMLAADDRPVIVEGEAGTGKEFLARLIHRSSTRDCGPFVSVPKRNVPTSAVRALIMDVMQSSSARQPRSPWLERARGGVLFLDLSALAFS